MGVIPLLDRRWIDFLDTSAGHPARRGVCPRQRKSLAVADVSLVLVRFSRRRRRRASRAVVLVDASGERGQCRFGDLRTVLLGPVWPGAGCLDPGDGI